MNVNTGHIGQNKPKYNEIVFVTPDMARQILDGNTINRTVRKNHVISIANIMRNGDWQVTAHGIVISDTGILIDGQHRLLALIESGLDGVFMRLFFGEDENTFIAYDRGAKRSAADSLRVRKEYAEVSSFLVRMINSNYSPKVTDAKVSILLDYIQPQIDELHAACNTSTKYYSSAPFRTAAVMRIMEGRSKDYAKKTYTALVRGDILSLPPSAASLYSAFARGHVKAKDTMDILNRAWRIFDEKNAAATKVVIKDSSLPRKEMLDILKNHISEYIYKELQA